MARIRTIKPEFFTSADIVELTPLSRLFYISLWCEADREGRLNWNLKTLKMRYLPADDCSIEDLANELIVANLIYIYQVSGRQYAEIPSFAHHQVINNRESDSIIPEMPDSCDASSTRESGVQGEGKEGRKGKEGKGRESASFSEEDILAAFNEFWDAFADKRGKEGALRIWRRKKLTSKAADVINGAKRYAKARGDNRRYWKQAQGWLNDGRWDDDVVSSENCTNAGASKPQAAMRDL